MKRILLSLVIFSCAQLVSNTALAGGENSFEFVSANKKIKVIYTRTTKILIEVYTKNNLVFTMSFNEDYGDPRVDFVDINNDDLPDIIIKLEDESGFEPVFLLSKPESDKFIRALPKKSLKVDYTNLETNIPGKLYEAYTIENDKHDVKTLVFHHLYIGRTLKHQVRLTLNDPKTDLIIQY